jgi:hypothetical protein
MARTSQRSRRGNTRNLVLALLCVLLVVVAGTVQLVHTHADGAADHASCSLCVVAHVTVHAVQGTADRGPIILVEQLESVLRVVPPRGRTTLAMFIRPPPVDVVSA